MQISIQALDVAGGQLNGACWTQCFCLLEATTECNLESSEASDLSNAPYLTSPLPHPSFLFFLYFPGFPWTCRAACQTRLPVAPPTPSTCSRVVQSPFPLPASQSGAASIAMQQRSRQENFSASIDARWIPPRGPLPWNITRPRGFCCVVLCFCTSNVTSVWWSWC